MSRSTGQISTVIKIPGATVGVNTTAYADNDLVGELITLNCGRSGILQYMTLQDLDGQNSALEVYVFDTYPVNTTFTNNSALDVADADLTKIIFHFSIAATDYLALADNSVGTEPDLAFPYYAADGKNLYIAFRSAAATPTYTANGLSAVFGLLVDGE